MLEANNEKKEKRRKQTLFTEEKEGDGGKRYKGPRLTACSAKAAAAAVSGTDGQTQIL